MTRRTGLIVFCAIAILHISLLVYGIFIHGPGWDEVGHLPAGLSHWDTGRFDLYRVNPPLVRMVAVIPAKTEQHHLVWDWNPVYEIKRSEWSLGRELIEVNRDRYLTILRLARLGCLPFAIIGLWIVWFWSNELFGSWGGVLSALVWALSPIVITNAQMMTPDTGSAAIGAIACYGFSHWISSPTYRMALLCGLGLGLAELTKFTWLILYVVWPIQWILSRWIGHRAVVGRSVVPELGQLVALFTVSMYVINAGYGFEGSFTSLNEYRFFSKALTGLQKGDESRGVPGNRFQNSLLGHAPIPLPRNMLQGIDQQKVDFESKFFSYLNGQWQRHGWWYYYIWGILIKEPLGFLSLGLLATVFVGFSRWTKDGMIAGVNLLSPAICLLAFVSSQTGFNHHLRYVLPAMIFFTIGIGVLGSPVAASIRFVRPLATILALLGATASLSIFPHSHAYFNELIGGWRNGPLYLLDSNCDWGQDILLVDRWANEHPDQPLDGVEHATPRWLGVQNITKLPQAEVPRLCSIEEAILRSKNRLSEFGPRPGRFALSVRALYESHNEFAYFLRLKPSGEIGCTTRIYEITAAQAAQIRSEAGLPPYSAAAKFLEPIQ